MNLTDSALLRRGVTDAPTGLPESIVHRRAHRAEEDKTRTKPPRPDAPLRSVGRFVTALLHAGVLLGIVSLLLWYVMQIPGLTRRQAVVSVVARSHVELRSPTEGVFVAVNDLLAGTRVKKGHVLGHVRAPQLAARIDATERRLYALRCRKLLLEKPEDELDQPRSEFDLGQERRECVEKIVAAESELDRLRRIKRDLRIVSTVSGRIQYGVSGSAAVTTNETVVHVWPEGGDLVVEVRAPLKVIHELLRENHVVAQFPTAHGVLPVTSRPIPGSLRVSALEHGTGREKELWGFLQCRPVSIPEPVAHPGAIGTL